MVLRNTLLVAAPLLRKKRLELCLGNVHVFRKTSSVISVLVQADSIPLVWPNFRGPCGVSPELFKERKRRENILYAFVLPPFYHP